MKGCEEGYKDNIWGQKWQLLEDRETAQNSKFKKQNSDTILDKQLCGWELCGTLDMIL